MHLGDSSAENERAAVVDDAHSSDDVDGGPVASIPVVGSGPRFLFLVSDSDIIYSDPQQTKHTIQTQHTLT